MNEYLGELIILFLATALIAAGATLLSIYISHRLRILDLPSSRKSHRVPVAYLGGLGILLAFLLGLVGYTWYFPGIVLTHDNLFVLIVAGALAIFLLGTYDDIRPMNPMLKLGLQIAIALAMWYGGVRVEMIALFGSEREQLGTVLSLVVTLGWFVGLMNAINLVDGLDGLAGGICLIGALALVGVSFSLVLSDEVLVGAGLCVLIGGAVLGFLLFNWHPARIFMGDGGALLLGFLLATASIIGSTKTPTLLALSIPLVALGLPLFETGFSFLRRLVKGSHPFQPDRRHLHHRLLAIGLDQRRVVVILLFITAFLGINAVLLAASESGILFLNVILLVFGIVLLIENIKYVELKKAREAEASPPGKRD